MTSSSRALNRESAPPDERTSSAVSARLGLRASAYVIDSIVLLGFVLVSFVVSGLVLWISSDLGAKDPPDAGYYAFVGIFIGLTLIAWSAFNVALLCWRAQTVGQYLTGLRVVDENGQPTTPSRQTARWFALHPLLFHPVLIPVWALFAAIAVSITLSQLVLGLTLALVALCVVAPLVAFASAVLDPGRRALHDRVTGTIVAPLSDSPSEG
jgi:uncharacterized RDD family membrane protein YckC